MRTDVLKKLSNVILSCEIKIFYWLIRIQHLECYCLQNVLKHSIRFYNNEVECKRTKGKSNVKEQKGTMANTTDAQDHQMLYLQTQVTLQSNFCDARMI